MPQLAIVADDLTGAADTGACFAAAGLSTVIPLSRETLPTADVVVLSTETRNRDAVDAVRIVAEAVRTVVAGPHEFGARWIYKKIDSALRGHPRDELLATLTAVGVSRTIVAPAFPAAGRTTVGGHQRIAGAPVASRRFGARGDSSDLVALFENDRGIPVDRLDLPTIRGQPATVQRRLDEAAPGILVADAETDDDLEALAQAASKSSLRVLCGTAGFARALTRVLPLAPLLPSSIGTVSSGPILIVAGSQHDATARQIEVLRQAGLPIVTPPQRLIDDAATSWDELVTEVARHLAAGRSTVLTTSGLAEASHPGRTVAERLAAVAAAEEVRCSVGGMVLTGGDVATAVCEALGGSALWLRGEISPGLPWGVLVNGAGLSLPVATKAGSFGDDRALLRCIDVLAAELDQEDKGTGPLQ